MFENIFIAVLGLILVFEGIMPFAFPRQWKKIMQELSSLSELKIRIIGLIAMILGILIIVIFD